MIPYKNRSVELEKGARKRLWGLRLWRFLGFVSTLVGFFTFAITPPFNKLVEHRLLGLFVIALYCALGSIVCVTMLCTIPWRVSESAVLTAHVVFAVLMLTSLYSFFMDKFEGDREIKDGQRVLNLISCGAFSVMSLSLSRLTRLGFETGVFSFFLGSLNTMVLAWNWKFTFVVAMFCYILILIRTCSDSQRKKSSLPRHRDS